MDCPGLVETLCSLVSIHLKRQAPAQAHLALKDGAAIARALAAVPCLLQITVAAAQLAVMEGQAERAAQWPALAAAHPQASADLKLRVAALSQLLTPPLSPNALAAARQAGRALDLATLIATIAGERPDTAYEGRRKKIRVS